MKSIQKKLCLLLALLLPMLLTGCGKEEEDVFQVLFGAPYVSQERAAAYGEALEPETQVPIKYTALSFGSDGVDAGLYGANAMMLTARIVAGEVDVMVLDIQEAARYARSDMFFDLTKIFTAEELGDRELITYDYVDMNGEPTGEKTVPCGLNISGNTELTRILGSDNYGIFLVCNTADLDTAKAVFRAIVNS